MSDTGEVGAIVLEVEVPVDAATAWRAITDPTEVAQWFAEVTPVDGVGSPYRVDFGEGSAIEGRVRSLDPGRRVSYTWAWAGEDGPTTLVTWEVHPGTAAGSSIIRLTHDGWSEAGATEESRDDHANYWATYLAELEAMLATTSVS